MGNLLDSLAKISRPTVLQNMADVLFTVELVTSNTKSSTDEDKSLPPTPDGSGLPANFSEVAPGIYRSSYPQLPHFEELKALKLKTIL